MPYMTSGLSQGTQYNLAVQLAAGDVAVTIVSIKNSGAMSAEKLVNPNGLRAIGNGVTRIMIYANAPTGATGTFIVIQNGQTVADLVLGGSSPVDLVATFDVT